MKIFPVLLLCLLLCARYHAGAQTVLSGAAVLQGIVTDAAVGLPVSGATITNATQQVRVFSGDDGHFTIPANGSDVITVTSVGFKPSTSVAPAIFGRLALNIALQRSNYKLDEVIVRPNWTPYQADSAARAGTYARANAWRPSGSVMSPVSWLAETISGKKKRMKRWQNDFVSMEQARFTDTRYTPELVAAQTQLSGDTLALFMNRYPIPFDYARAATDIELKMWIRTNFREWVKQGRPLVSIGELKE